MKKRGSPDIVATLPKKRNLFETITTMLKKRGLSTIIATLLIVLFSLILIAVLWVVISNMISQNLETTKIQSEFFDQEVNFVKIQLDPVDGLKLNASIRTSRGTLKTSTQNITFPPSEIDIISVSDVSGSMRDCQGITSNCCTSSLKGTYENPHCYAILSPRLSQCSSSCGGTLFDSLNSSKSATKQLIDTMFQNPRDNNRVGLVAYNATVVNKFSFDLTGNSQLLKTTIDSWESIGGTCICCGINSAKDKFAGSPADRSKAMIIMSDGVANQRCSQQGTGDALNDAIKAACDAYSQVPNLTIYSVGLGSEVDPVTMTAIAQCGNGEYFPVSDVSNLVNLYQSLADQLIKKFNALHKLNYLKVVFYDNAGSSTIVNVDIPGPLQTTNHEFNLNGQGLSNKVVKIEIYPVASTRQGKEVTGPIFDVWERK